MIGSTANGCPRPVGSEFRQRQIWAESPRASGRVPWVVSVVDTITGPVIEAYCHLHTEQLVATDVDSHSDMFHDVLVQARDLLADDGWTIRRVVRCKVLDCRNPLPMWAAERKWPRSECLTCACRTVLACAECGTPDGVEVMDRERLLRDSLCLGCAMWTDRVGQSDAVLAENGHFYAIGNGRGHASSKGFGGARWTVTFHDGRVVETDDLWDGGVIPPWFRDRFPVNAVVKAKERRL